MRRTIGRFGILANLIKLPFEQVVDIGKSNNHDQREFKLAEAKIASKTRPI